MGPAARFRSEQAFHGVNCTTQALREALRAKLNSLRATPMQDDCHYIPQSSYYQNGRSCQHLIKQENFKEDFQALLARFGFSADIEIKNRKVEGCDARFDQVSLDKLHYYSADYAAFGYELEYLAG